MAFEKCVHVIAQLFIAIEKVVEGDRGAKRQQEVYKHVNVRDY